MKTKELIRQLQQADPSGEEEVVIGNESILYAENLPAYYDGPYQTLIRNEANGIIGITIHSQGRKVDIRQIGLDDVFLDEPDMPVTYDSECSNTRAWVEEKRTKMREIIASVDRKAK